MFGLPIFLCVLVPVCGYAFWRGGAPERVVAGLFIAAWAVTMIGHLPFGRRYYQVDPLVFSVDACLSICLLCVALRADRHWPLFASAFNFVILLAHMIKFLDPDLIRRAYAIMIYLWPYLQLAVLAIGTWRHRRRLIRKGTDRSWSTFLVRSTG
ncbi:hypothetical protein LZK98_17695 [Sphingomonas cannabina]|uniref:hypothetical protein n=1 Tax=Sphingomonas cannabina TaxID=2899123 RepID=UPI001F4465C3|nr:hypothetical protein [Sphingomonas cannabina]UIJ44862.1 hypothetical protein LZK98_17695 [Sphingomonas cannabina]